jgi:AcrR family transcriptional regulator
LNGSASAEHGLRWWQSGDVSIRRIPGVARTGRRPGRSGSREAILDAARRSFAERGYDRTTIRGVALDAGVDPALVAHYFGPKDALFAAALELPRAPVEALAAALDAPDGELGARIAATFLSVWDGPGAGALVALLRSASANEQAAETMRQFARTELVPRIAERIGGRRRELRGALIVSQLIGLAMMRYILRMEPVASASTSQLVTRLGPAIQQYVEFNR